jgi:hypothetical protein
MLLKKYLVKNEFVHLAPFDLRGTIVVTKK